jgi:hypothetical protein
MCGREQYSTGLLIGHHPVQWPLSFPGDSRHSPRGELATGLHAHGSLVELSLNAVPWSIAFESASSIIQIQRRFINDGAVADRSRALALYTDRSISARTYNVTRRWKPRSHTYCVLCSVTGRRRTSMLPELPYSDMHRMIDQSKRSPLFNRQLTEHAA